MPHQDAIDYGKHRVRGVAARGRSARRLIHNPARRSKELAIRISLGADAGTIWRAVMGQALIPVIAGLASGLIAAVLAGPLLRSLLFHVNPTNPAVLLAAVATVGIAAICACLGPAYRASRTDPLLALRAD